MVLRTQMPLQSAVIRLIAVSIFLSSPSESPNVYSSPRGVAEIFRMDSSILLEYHRFPRVRALPFGIQHHPLP